MVEREKKLWLDRAMKRNERGHWEVQGDTGIDRTAVAVELDPELFAGIPDDEQVARLRDLLPRITEIAQARLDSEDYTRLRNGRKERLIALTSADLT